MGTKNVLKINLFLLIFIAFSSLNYAFEIREIENTSTIINELQNPAIYKLNIFNEREPEIIQIYSLSGVEISPAGTLDLKKGDNIITIKAQPNKNLKNFEGPFVFEYEIKGWDSGIKKSYLSMFFEPLKEAIDIEIKDIKYTEPFVEVILKNKKNAYIEKIFIQLDSLFFNYETELELKPFETKTIRIPLDRKQLEKIYAGKYLVKILMGSSERKIEIEKEANYLDYQDIKEEKQKKGLIIRKTIITKTNLGNKEAIVKIEEKKNILSRLFTTFNLEPIKKERKGLSIYYEWEKLLKPGEKLEIEIVTNYTIPFIVLLLTVMILLFIRIHSSTNAILTKRVVYVKTKSNDFALKVLISIKARKDISDIHIHDTIPYNVNLYEKYGTKPDKFDEKTRKLTWTINKLMAGEQRTISYIIYSKLKVIGRFEIPLARATFKRGEKQEIIVSNKTFFIADITNKVD